MATILVVDDSAPNRNTMAALLRADGQQVLCADNAWRGLTILESMPIDLVILALPLARQFSQILFLAPVGGRKGPRLNSVRKSNELSQMTSNRLPRHWPSGS